MKNASVNRPSLWKTVNKRLLVIAFFLAILLPSLFFGHPGAAFDALKENRRLVEFPQATMFFFEDLEKWYLDHFGGRANLIYYGARWQMEWMGIPANRKVLLGRDQWLFYDQHYQPGQAIFADFQGKKTFSTEQLENIHNNLMQTQRALAKCNIRFYLTMPPDKQTIYADMMPFKRTADTQTRADQLFARLSTEPELHFVDMRSALHAARRSETLPLYLKTDTHWNALGAYHGTQALLDTLAHDQLASPAWPQRRDYQISSKPFTDGDIAVSLLSLPNYFEDQQITLDLPDNTKLLSESPHTAHGKSSKRLLLYGDSFSHLMRPFLNQHFNHVATVLKARVEAEDIQKERPDVIVLEVLERLLGSLEAWPDKLPDCIPSP